MSERELYVYGDGDDDQHVTLFLRENIATLRVTMPNETEAPENLTDDEQDAFYANLKPIVAEISFSNWEMQEVLLGMFKQLVRNHTP